VVGLPGDAEHEQLFSQVAEQWRDALSQSLRFAAADIHVLFGKAGKAGLAAEPASPACIKARLATLQQKVAAEDRLWVFLLGHGNYDGEHAYFHLPGHDLSAEEWARLFAPIKCREQVFWLTMPASGWFLRPLSAKGRIVITATLAEDEFNETEFPQALATVLKRPRAQLDTSKDGQVSVLELFQQTVAEVNARFQMDNRVPTEHALLDDNGDGLGTEQPTASKADLNKPVPDGALAARTYLPYK
jgi:hypothetical protein